MNSLKKYIPKRKYKERGQLESRKRLGFLEKKKDYKVRAEDYHKKESKYKKLVESARTKNPDEFYFQMNNSKIIDGENFTLREDSDRVKVVNQRLSNHQKVLNLVNHKRSQLMKSTKKLEEELNGVTNNLIEKTENDDDDNDNVDYSDDENREDNNNNSNSNGNDNKPFKHKLFFDSLEEIENFDAEKHFSSKFINNTLNRIRDDQLSKFNFNSCNLSKAEIKAQAFEKKAELKKLIQSRERLNTLTKISNTLDYQKNMIKPGKKRKLENDDGLCNYKFFAERKK